MSRLWIVDPSVRTAEERGVAEILHDWHGSSRIFRPVLQPGDGPASADGYDTDGVVLMGSAVSVYDDLDWIRSLSAWIAPLIRGDVDVPLLGICFGHQLIAHLAGGAVGYLDEDHAKRVGVETSAIDATRLLGEPAELRVVVSHREEVTRAPDGYRVVARRNGVPVDGLEHESRPISSFQFHPEAREDFAGRAGFSAEAIDERVRRDSQRLLGAFRDQVRATIPQK